MTNVWDVKVAELQQHHKMSSAVVSTLHTVLSRLPDHALHEIVLEEAEDYGVILRWHNSCMEIRQASGATLFVWVTFERFKSNKITTGEERVFTDEEVLRDWLDRHAHEL